MGAASSSRKRVSTNSVARGLSVIQGDADSDLKYYPDGGFDYVILSQTLQATRNPKNVLTELLRIGEKAIVSFPNFGHWRVRASLAINGRMPVTKDLPYSWYDTPNIHFCTINDFVDMTKEVGRSGQVRRRAECLGRAPRIQHAMGVLEPLRPAGCVFAQTLSELLLEDLRKNPQNSHEESEIPVQESSIPPQEFQPMRVI